MESKQLLKDALGWGMLLWLIGYLAGILLYAIAPVSLIGWIITPLATLITIWVLFRKIRSTSMQHYIVIALVWMALAVLLDYLFIVKAFKPADGYYKPDVYLYYLLTLLLPVAVGLWKQKRERGPEARI